MNTNINLILLVLLLSIKILPQYPSQNTSFISRIADGRNNGICIIDHYAYVGGGGNLYVFDITNSNDIKLKNKIITPGYITEIKIANNYAFVVNGPQGVRIFDISNIESPIEISYCSTPAFANRIYVDNNRLYIADLFYGLKIFDISNTNSPIELGGIYTYGYGEDVVAKDGIVYFADNYEGLQIFNAQDPSHIAKLISYNPGQSVEKLLLKDNYLIMTDQFYGIRIIDVLNPSNPNEVSSIQINVDRTLVLEGNTLYTTASNYIEIDISDINNPSIIRSKDIGGGYITSIAKYNQVMLFAFGWQGFKLLDITENGNYNFLDSYGLPNYIRSVFVKNNYAYTAYGYSGLRIYDLTNLYDIQFASNFNVLTHNQNSNDLVGFELVNNFAYLLTDYDGLQVVNLSDPLNPIFTDSLRWNGISPTSISIKDNHAYLSYYNYGLLIIDISDPYNLIVEGLFESGIKPGYVKCHGDYLFVTDYADLNNIYLRVLDISDPLNPILISSYLLPGNGMKFEIKDDLLFVACESKGLRIIDFSNINSLYEIANYNPGNNFTSDIKIVDHYAYLADGYNGLIILDITNIFYPIEIGFFRTGGFTVKLDFDRNNIFLADFDMGLMVIKNDLITSIIKEVIFNNELVSFQNYPNPFNSTTTISYEVSESGSVKIELYNILGELLSILVDEHQQSGFHSFNYDSKELHSGVYLYKITISNKQLTNKMVVIK
jgi:hypothetical protein